MKIRTYFGLVKATRLIGSLLPKDRVLNSQSAPAPIFIVGAPRTGSTIFYQVLTNHFELGYIDNLSYLFNQNFCFGEKVSRAIFKRTAHNVFKSDFGRTQAYSMHAPSEAGNFWYRFTPRSDEYIDEQKASSFNHQLLHSIVAQVSSNSGCTWIFKNLNLCQRLHFIKKAFPKARFIWIERDEMENAFSILRAREKLNVDHSAWWSAKPKNFEELQTLPLHDKIAAQIRGINKQLEEDLSLFDSSQVMRINYADFIRDTDGVLKKAGAFIDPQLKVRKGTKPFEMNLEPHDFQNDSNYTNFVTAFKKLDA